MPNAFTTLTNLITSPPGQLAAGAVLAGIVWKFFERVEAVLTDDTKLEIAVWLLGVKVGQKVAPWPETFAKVFDRVFGDKHLSWKCFWRSCLASYSAVVLVSLSAFGLHNFFRRDWHFLLYYALIANVIPDYLSLLESRYVLGLLRENDSLSDRILLLGGDALLTALIGAAAAALADSVSIAWNASDESLRSMGIPRPTLFNDYIFRLYVIRYVPGIWFEMFLRSYSKVFFLAAFFTSIWLWLYAGSGFLLRAACRLDIGFDWFNRKFDIENKPLQSIGLVAGALVAVGYWTVMIVSRMVG